MVHYENKRTMKKILALCVALATLVGTAHADEKRAIDIGQLPAAGQEFLKTYFDGHTVAFVAEEGLLWGKEYEVRFTDGTQVEFDEKGAWKEVRVRAGAVPDALVPQDVAGLVGRDYPQVAIRGIERDRQGWEVRLSNGLELEFDRQMRLVDIDD